MFLFSNYWSLRTIYLVFLPLTANRILVSSWFKGSQLLRNIVVATKSPTVDTGCGVSFVWVRSQQFFSLYSFVYSQYRLQVCTRRTDMYSKYSYVVIGNETDVMCQAVPVFSIDLQKYRFNCHINVLFSRKNQYYLENCAYLLILLYWAHLQILLQLCVIQIREFP